MSSYFDEMGRRAYQAEQKGDQAKAEAILSQAKQQVADYLDWIEKHALKREAAKVAILRDKFESLRPPRLTASFAISGDLHELGHDIGRARIAIRGGRYAGDNPYFPGHFEIGGEI